ncbi:YcnI family copper-binding membrane protein [Sinomonas notoginsengisoli]|uniref:YcnI family copper-binding membrane protein n=1 Tax=Sinomonas notoginsengisoli TaxID=1457311 RepID=UPI001F194471|nr:YcnI family protein [Sinomonas notoginsengisoli]
MPGIPQKKAKTTMNTSFRRALKAAATTAATAALIAAGAAAANAHVTVNTDDTGANGYSHLTFNMPNESPTAKTNKLDVKLPTDTPFTSVSVKPVEGWTAQVITTDLPKPVTVAGATVTKAPTEVVWTANDPAHEIGQNQYQAFSISVGRLPAAGVKVVFPAAQTYTDGKVVNWDEKAEEGQPEPKHPAPSFTTTAADDANQSQTPSKQAAAPVSQTTDATGAWGLGLGLLGAILGAAALTMVPASRRRTAK